MSPDAAPTEGRSTTGASASDPSTSSRQPRIFYKGSGVAVTSEYFVSAGRRFSIDEIDNLRTVRGRYDRLWISVAALAVALGAASVWTWSSLGAGVGGVLVASAVMVAVLAAALRQRRPRLYELWCHYQGLLILIFTTDDERHYGQVCRALMRAREHSRLGTDDRGRD